VGEEDIPRTVPASGVQSPVLAVSAGRSRVSGRW
jgi:hypothetical protein